MTTESIKIESQDVTIENLYKDFYSVPDFQREYVWEREQVEKLLQDVYDEFYDENSNIINNTEYFLGSIVVCKDSDGAFSLIDGQQRMTTIYLILCALRDIMVEMGGSPNRALVEKIKAAYTNDQGDEENRHRLVLQYEDSRDVLRLIADDPENIDSVTENTVSVERIIKAYQDVSEFLRVNFDNDAARVKHFYATFIKRVKLIRIITPSLANALKVFETINDRGVGLNAMDLLKNLLFIKTAPDEYSRLKSRWKELIDILDNCKEKPLRFLRYFIMANYQQSSGKPLREDEIYSWLTENSNLIEIDEKPLSFLDMLVDSAEAWSNFLKNRDVDNNYNPYLANLSILSGAARQHFILLLAGRKLPAQEFNTLCKSIENLFFCYIITREPTRTFERNFSVWSTELRSVNSHNELENFINNRITSDLARRRKAFDFALSNLSQNRIQQYRMRYILAKITQYIEQQAWSNPAHNRLDQYIAPTVDIEHILPQKPKQIVIDNFDKPAEYYEYVEKLGNLTLLEKTINTSVSNDMYSLKKQGYLQSGYLLTRSLVEKPNVGTNTSLNRAVKDLIQFEEWSSQTIEQRQNMLTKIAAFVWGMPVAEEEDDD